MKKFYLVFLLCFLLAHAREQELLNVDPPEENYPNLSTRTCDENCLFKLLEAKLYLSFLSEFVESNNELLSRIYEKLSSSITDFDQTVVSSDQKKIQADTSSPTQLAIIIPEKTLKSYSNVIINSSFAYLVRQKAKVKVKVFLIGTEEGEKLQEVLKQIEAQGYEYAIAGLTSKGASMLSHYRGNLKIFIPTLNKSAVSVENENVYFGGIDYNAQIAKLLEHSNSNIAVFSDGSDLASNLNSKILKQREQARVYRIEGEKLDFQRLFRSYGGLRGASIFLNTPLIKTAFVSSQLRVHNIYPFILLSTQINYNPTFLSLTQANDRKNFLIANSIDKNDENLNYLNEIFNQSLDYNWIAYTTSVGIDYFYTKFLNTQSDKIFKEELQNSQFTYRVRLMRALGGNFEELQ